MSGPRTAAAVGGLALLAALAGTPPASAADGDGKRPRMVTVLDVSGSMKERDVGGGTRMEAAKDAVHTLIDGLPAEAEMGIRVYGSEYPGADKKTGCKDTKLLTPIRTMPTPAVKQDAKGKISALKETGFTPIGVSLKAAAKDLGGSGERRIILVSDGEETCAPPDPCEVAKELDGAGVDLTVDTLGLKVSGKAEAQLKCVAEATGGSYDRADDADDLSADLQGLFRTAYQGYAISGRPVDGTRDCADAPLVGPGQYRDELAGDQRKYYRMEVKPGQQPGLGFTMVPQSGFMRGTQVKAWIHRQGDDPDTDSLVDANDVVLNWAHVISTGGAVDEPLGKDLLRKGDRYIKLCLGVYSGLTTKKPDPAELVFMLAGPGSAEDGARGPEPAADAGGGTAGAGDSKAQTAGESSDPEALWLGAAGAGGLLLGGLAAGVLKSRRNRSGGALR